MTKHLLSLYLFWALLLSTDFSKAQGASKPGLPIPPSGEALGSSDVQEAKDPHTVIGEISSTYLNTWLYAEPTVALMDMSNILSGHPEEFVPEEHQILGYFTEPLFPGPGKYRVDLPFQPPGNRIDLYNNGREDDGVIVYSLLVSANIIGNSYLQQLEQVYTNASGYRQADDSFKGSFLVYAPDENQGFSGGAGPDGAWFTGDDPGVGLEQGYTKVTLMEDGKTVFNRSDVVDLNYVQPPARVVPDFSEQGILESYGSLLDLLAERYAYTDYRGLDWRAIRVRYLPAVTAADAKKDYTKYFLILDSLAMSLEDAHVSATARGNLDAAQTLRTLYQTRYGAGIGARGVLLRPSKAEEPGADRIVILTVGEDGPAAQAGWKAGTEILTVNGKPTSQWLREIPLSVATGVEEVQQLARSRDFFSFPDGSAVTFTYRQPGEATIREITLTAGDHSDGWDAQGKIQTPIHLELRGNYVILQWSDFATYILAKIAVLEEAVALAKSHSSAGMILDLRGNLGGYMELYETMASYFFTSEEPMQKHINDEFLFDSDKGAFINIFNTDYLLNAPKPDLAFTGPVLILVDEGCQSSCEYFAEHLQRLGRAQVVGQYSSIGAGGAVTPVILPSGLGLSYTWGRSLIAGTDEPNLEAKGVKPDIRVPVTLDTELAKLKGEDPVLDTALAVLERQSSPLVRLSATPWKLVKKIKMADQSESAIESPEAYTLAYTPDGDVQIKADCNQAKGSFSIDAYTGMTIELGPTTLAMCPEGSLSDTYLKDIAGVVGYGIEDGQLILITLVDKESFVLAFEPMEE